MEVLAIFASSFVLAFSGAMMPGPLLTVTITESARRGFIAGPLLILGHALLELLLVVALLLGLASVLTNPQVGSTIAIVGGIFLLYMGWGMARDAHQGKIKLELPKVEGSTSEPESKKVGLHPVAAGIFVSLSNPYWSLWWATLGLGYITLSLKEGTAGLVSFFTGHILADFIWYSLIAGAVVAGRKFLSQRIYQRVLVLCGLFLICLGGLFVYRGFSDIT
ncbi:LysE family transporter [Desulfotomaculum sp. 1211_IL3151]|uniref:LysE family transporter n=1 Tax=Desulfotomaculum sp. 1211_IL3151 TaxID=3084055 RepID=UPI002FDA0CF8